MRATQRQPKPARSSRGDAAAPSEPRSALEARIRAEERARIAAELHDDLGQQLTALRTSLALARARLPASAGLVLAKQLEGFERAADDAFASLGRACEGLAPIALARHGLATTVRTALRDFAQRTGIPVESELAFDERGIGAAIQASLYRILEECLTNIERHARATRVAVRLHQDRSTLSLEVADDGIGLDGPRVRRGIGRGLLDIRRHALSLGGKVRIESKPASGTIIRVRTPLSSPSKTGASK